MKKDFYIYEWYNTDTNEVFYVGKGTKGRYKNTYHRNTYFKNYLNKYNCDVLKVKIDLDEDEAFELEKELIKKYRIIGQCMCNFTDGGEGGTFPVGSWHFYYRKLLLFYLHGKTEIMQNTEEYEPENLKGKSLKRLEKLYLNYLDKNEDNKWFNSLDIYNEDGNLNIGWECFED